MAIQHKYLKAASILSTAATFHSAFFEMMVRHTREGRGEKGVAGHAERENGVTLIRRHNIL